VPPALERMVRHCVEKNPAQRFQSAGDLAFNLESLTDGAAASRTSGQTAIADGSSFTTTAQKKDVAGGANGEHWRAHWRWRFDAGRGLVVGTRQREGSAGGVSTGNVSLGSIGNARFTPDGSFVYSASWDGGDNQLYVGRTDDPGARELG